MPETPAPTYPPWLHRFALLTAAMTLVLVCVGGLVTSHGAGMAVPDWPNTYGYNLFLFPPAKWIGGILYEHTHRLVAALVGLLTTILAVWLWARETHGRQRWLGSAAVASVIALMGARRLPVYVILAGLAPVVIGIGFWRFKKNPGALRWLGIVALAAVILQGVLGGLRVVWFKDPLGIFHATLAQLFFGLTCAIALLTSRWWSDGSERRLNQAGGDSRPTPDPTDPLAPATARNLRWMALVTTLLITGQLILGATMRHQHAGLAIRDFPLAYGRLWPAMDADSVARYNQQRIEVMAANPITAFQIGLQMAHRLAALAILVGVGMTTGLARKQLSPKKPLRALALVWSGLILAQIGLGAATIWTDKAADVATAHVLVGALAFATGALWCLIAFRRRAPVSGTGLASEPSGVFRISPRQMSPTAAVNP